GQNGNGQSPVVVVPGFDNGGGQGTQVDPIARYLMVKDAYKNTTLNVTPPVDASAKAQVDSDFYLKYAIAAFDLFNAHRKRIVNEQDSIFYITNDAGRTR